MTITYKNSNVKLDVSDSAVLVGIHIVASVYDEHGLDLTITSGSEGHPGDGVHSANSLHYKGKAFDCRIWDIPESYLPIFVDKLKMRLGKDFDVVWHPVNHKTHIHVEYDPK